MMEGHFISDVNVLRFFFAMDLVLNLLMKFITRTPNVKGYVSRQQLWLTSVL